MWKRMWKRATRWLASMRKRPDSDPGLKGQIEPDETQEMPELRIDPAPKQEQQQPLDIDELVTPTQADGASIESTPLPDQQPQPVIDEPVTPTQTDAASIESTTPPEQQPLDIDELVTPTQEMPASRIDPAQDQPESDVAAIDDRVTPVAATPKIEPAPGSSAQNPFSAVIDVPQEHESPSVGTPDNPLPFPRNDKGEFDYDAVEQGKTYYTPTSPGSQPQQPEQVDFYRPRAPEGASVPTENEINRVITSAETDSQPPLTNRVRVPPELADQPQDQQLPPGLEFAPPQNQQQPDTPQSPTDKPATEQQSDQLIQLIGEQTRVLESIRDGQGHIQTAIENLAMALENSGGVV